MTKSLTLPEQLSGVVFGLVTMFSLFTAVYGFTGYNVYIEVLGLDDGGISMLYMFFALLSAERLFYLATDGVDI